MKRLFPAAALACLLFLGSFSSLTAQPVLQFCGEVLPANQPAITQEWLKALSHQAAQADWLTTLKHRSAVLFPIIEPIIAQFNIPADFKYIPLIESGAQNHTVSSKGAAGFWQLMPGTARSLGLSVARRHDDRYDLRKATVAACRYLRELYEELGSWTLVAAAYNDGPNYVQAIRRRFPDHHALALPYQASATKSYVYKAVALKELFTKPQDYRAYLSDYAVTQLSIGNPDVTEAERLAILNSFDPTLTDNYADSVAVTESTLIPGDDDVSAPVLAQNPTELPTPIPAQPADTEMVAVHLETRNVAGEALTEGKLCLFEAVQPVTINGVSIAVGDLIYAHVEAIDRATGRVFMRTEKVISTPIQQTVKIRLTAISATRQPGIVLPGAYAPPGLKLIWEAL